MKNIITSLRTAAAILAATIAASGCGGQGTGNFNNAGGKPYEVVLSAPNELWNGEAGDTLRSIMLEPVPLLNQNEPRFDLARIEPGALKDLLLRHRNILIVDVDPALDSPMSEARYNLYARPQIIVRIAAPDYSSLVAYLSDNRTEIQTLFENNERDRAVAYNRKYGEKQLDDRIAEMFGIRMNIPGSFTFRGSSEDGRFLYVGCDVRSATQGLAVYSYPYTGHADLSVDSLVARRNEFMSRIPGPSDGSFMTTSPYFEPEVRYIRINGRQWAEMRGFWDVENDFMGGPFTNYTTLDPATGDLISIDCFVYSPKEPKRNLLRQLEHTVWSVEFPSSGQEAE